MSTTDNIEEGAPLLAPIETFPSKSSWPKIVLAVAASVGILTLGVLGSYESVDLNSTTEYFTDFTGIYAVDSTKYTGWNIGNSEEPIYLDRHDVDCGTNALKSFSVQRSGNDIRYKYVCLKGDSLGVVKQVSKNTGKEYSRRVHYLDRQSYASCTANSFLSRFRAQNHGGDYVSYDYTCTTYNGKWGTCRQEKTSDEYIQDEEIYYLDRFSPSCGSGEAMVKLRPDGESGNVHYDYKCCKLEMNDPTQAPIASPTLVPVAEPTHVPVANPTKAPTLEPTASPTENAPLFCPLEVNNDFKGILKNLKEGCASVAEDDIGWDQIKDGSKAMIICTNQQVTVTLDDLIDAGIHGTSFMAVGPKTEIDFHTKDGVLHRFIENSDPIVHKKNDIAVSIVIKAMNAKNVPTRCQDI